MGCKISHTKGKGLLGWLGSSCPSLSLSIRDAGIGSLLNDYVGPNDCALPLESLGD